MVKRTEVYRFGLDVQIHAFPNASSTAMSRVVTTDTLVKAGTPVRFDFLDRKARAVVDTVNPNGVLVNDAEPQERAGAAVCSILLDGYVALNRLEEDVQEMITPAVREALEPHIRFLEIV